MPLYTDMIMDNFEDYANHHEDDGVIKLQNMPEDASMEQWGFAAGLRLKAGDSL